MEKMSSRQISRYTSLVNRRSFILLHSGVSWKPEYGAELGEIDRELKTLRVLADQEHERRGIEIQPE